MKTQFSFYKYGFTLVELMIVISILAMLFYSLSKFTFNPQENIVKAERLANKIAAVIHEWLINVKIWRMDMARNPVTQAIISFSTSTGMSWRYTSILSGSFAPPFYDGDIRYEIRDITWTGWRSPWAVSGTSAYISFIMTGDRVSFSGITNDTATIVTIRSRYGNMNKKIIFDRRTGRIEVNKD
jgi:prepilin-type N-terminal cleavage/methylation domain-containing protein